MDVIDELLNGYEDLIDGYELEILEKDNKIEKITKQRDFYKQIADQYMQPVPGIKIDNLPANLKPNGVFGNDNHIKGNDSE